MQPARHRSNSAISLQDLGVPSQAHVANRISSSSTAGRSDESSCQNSHNGQCLNQDYDNRSDQESSATRGVEDEPREESETAPSWPKPVLPVVKFWAAHVSCEVDMKTARDHLALERTFLGYLRTSMMMSIIGTLIAQLFTIQHHDKGFGYTMIGKPLATTCFAFSILTILLGATRSWRHQCSMMEGKALSGGIELHLIGVGTLVLVIVFFVFLVAIDVVKVESYKPAETQRT